MDELVVPSELCRNAIGDPDVVSSDRPSRQAPQVAIKASIVAVRPFVAKMRTSFSTSPGGRKRFFWIRRASSSPSSSSIASQGMPVSSSTPAETTSTT